MKDVVMRRRCSIQPGIAFFQRGHGTRWLGGLVVLAVSLPAGRIVAQEIDVDFDDEGPTKFDELEELHGLHGRPDLPASAVSKEVFLTPQRRIMPPSVHASAEVR